MYVLHADLRTQLVITELFVRNDAPTAEAASEDHVSQRGESGQRSVWGQPESLL